MATNRKLTVEEEYFCELYVHGDAPFAGNKIKCYKEAFGDNGSKTCGKKASNLLERDDIAAKIAELEKYDVVNSQHLKRFLSKNLMHIIEECTTAQFRDRNGTLLSCAPLRSVAVNASKALMELYPVKEAQEHKVSIDSGGEGGITFNLIVPESKKTEKKDTEE